MSKILKKIFILPVHLYQLILSPFFGGRCRYTPSCSVYMIEAIEEWGVVKGIYLGTKRLLVVILGADTDESVPRRNLLLPKNEGLLVF